MDNLHNKPITSYDRLWKRMNIQEETGCEGYEIIFPEDREASGFDSQNMFNSVRKLSEADQKKVHLTMQWINSFDGLHPVLIGDYARANYSNHLVDLKPMAEFVIDNYLSFANFVKEEFKKKNIEVNFLREYFEIEKYGCMVYSRELTPEFRESRTDAEFVKVFGHSVAISPSILYTK